MTGAHTRTAIICPTFHLFRVASVKSLRIPKVMSSNNDTLRKAINKISQPNREKVVSFAITNLVLDRIIWQRVETPISTFLSQTTLIKSSHSFCNSRITTALVEPNTVLPRNLTPHPFTAYEVDRQKVRREEFPPHSGSSC